MFTTLIYLVISEALTELQDPESIWTVFYYRFFMITVSLKAIV